MSCFSQRKQRLISHSDTIQILRNIIEKGEMFGSIGGYEIAPIRQWYSFVYLFSMSTNTELLQMTKDTSPYLRLYAYMGLYHNKYLQIEQLQNILSHDSSKVSALEGCVLYETTVGRGVLAIRNWYGEKPMNAVLKALQADPIYKRYLFIALQKNKRIKHYLAIP
jgi:hypothetical protein